MRRIAALLVLLAAGACAAKAPPALPATLKHPDFIYPAAPAELAAAPGADRLDEGWRFLQNDNLGDAERAFTEAARRNPALYPAQAGAAYVALARRDYQRARGGFETVLSRAPDYVPAIVGRGQALLGLMRDDEALAAFERAVTLAPALTELRGRIEVLRFRNVQELIASGRTAAGQGRLDEAKAALDRALAAAPGSALVYRELAIIERRQGNAAAALTHFRRAAALDPGDSVSLIQVGELLEEQLDFAGAEAAFRTANEIDPSPQLAARIAAIAARGRDARLPPEFQAIPAARQITRGDLAALIGVRLEDVVRAAPGRQDVLTDVRGHWAAPWITEVARAGIVAAFDNHTFQPRSPVRRVDLANAVSTIVLQLAASRPELRARIAGRPPIADVSATHLNYRQVAVAVASGVLPLLDGNRFDVARPVSGAEAVDAVTRLRALAASR